MRGSSTRVWWIGPLLAGAMALAACGGASSPTANQGQAAASAPASDAKPAAQAPAPAAKPAAPQVLNLKVDVYPGDDGGSKGPDGKTHDTFKPADLSVKVGQKVNVTFVNHDEMQHSFSSMDLGVNQIIPAAKDGKPGEVTLSFTPSKQGKFRWYCMMPCDNGAGGWAMTPDPNGKGVDRDGFMAGYVTVD